MVCLRPALLNILSTYSPLPMDSCNLFHSSARYRVAGRLFCDFRIVRVLRRAGRRGFPTAVC
jgi:hypothetical protein